MSAIWFYLIFTNNNDLDESQRQQNMTYGANVTLANISLRTIYRILGHQKYEKNVEYLYIQWKYR